MGIIGPIIKEEEFGKEIISHLILQLMSWIITQIPRRFITEDIQLKEESKEICFLFYLDPGVV